MPNETTPMGIKYPNSTDVFNAAGYDEPKWWADLALTVQAAIQDEQFTKGNLPADQDFDTVLENGSYPLAALPVDWQAQHMPGPERGILVNWKLASTANVQIFLTYDAVGAQRFKIRRRASGVWGDWSDPSSTATTTNDTAGSGMKRVGVPLSAGHSGLDAALEATVRIPLLFQAPIVRWRLRVQDINSRTGATRAGAVNVSSLWLGTHTGGGAMSGQQQLMTAFTIGDAANEYRTPWFNTPLNPGTEYLLSYGYTKATAPWSMIGHCYTTGDDANAGATNPAGMVSASQMPFTVSIEAETYAHTPVIASLSDSNGVGIGTSRPVFDSWLSQLCRRLKALPAHYGSSGETMTSSQDAGAYKFTRFSDLAKPDCVLFALGQNDVASDGQTLGTLQTLLGKVGENARAISDTLYYVNLLPRTTEPWAGFESLRRSYNSYLQALPGSGRDYFRVSAAISADDETITPAYDSGDGIHINTAGCAQMQATFTRPVTTPPVAYAA